VRVLAAKHEYLIRTPLKELLPQLDAQLFWQVHRGTVVRATAIDSVHRDEAGKLHLQLRAPQGTAAGEPCLRALVQGHVGRPTRRCSSGNGRSWSWRNRLAEAVGDVLQGMTRAALLLPDIELHERRFQTHKRIAAFVPVTPTPLSPLLLRGELVRPSVPRLALLPPGPAWGFFFSYLHFAADYGSVEGVRRLPPAQPACKASHGPYAVTHSEEQRNERRKTQQRRRPGRPALAGRATGKRTGETEGLRGAGDCKGTQRARRRERAAHLRDQLRLKALLPTPFPTPDDQPPKDEHHR
jgi:hypothetical protein